MNVIIYDIENTSSHSGYESFEVVVKKEIKDTNCFGINRLDWSESTFYVTTEKKDGHHFESDDVTFLGDYEDLGYCAGDTYYSMVIDNRTHYIKYSCGSLSLVDMHEDTKRITNLKTENALKELTMEKIQSIFLSDGSRGIYKEIDEKLRMIR